MNKDELLRARIYLGLSHDGLAEVLEVAAGRTVRRWEAGEKEVPGPAAVLLDVLIEFPEVREFLDIPPQPQWETPFEEWEKLFIAGAVNPKP